MYIMLNNFKNDNFLGKEVYSIGFDYKGVQQGSRIYLNKEEAEKDFKYFVKTQDKSNTITFEKCIVKECELETIEVLY